jgi:hypothetical protein
MNKHVQGYVTELVFHLDENGILDWEDRKTRKVIVPVTMDGRPIHHGVSGNVKRISVIACVSGAGESFTPLIVVLKNCSPVQEQLRKQGVLFGRDSILKSNHRSYFKVKIFFDDMKTVFLSHLVCLRGLAESAADDAAL